MTLSGTLFIGTLLVSTLIASIVQSAAHANQWQLQLFDQDGKPLDDAVVELTALNPAQAVEQSGPLEATITQQQLNFVPFVSAIQTGTLVDFPNLDRTRHHVYSFSAAKVFEIKLYHDRPEAPILFDQAGIVALGCNIHDYMEAYLFISDSPWLTVTDSTGQARFDALPAGRYQLKLWHPFQQAEKAPIEISIPDDAIPHRFQLQIEHRPKQPTPQRGFGG